MHLIEIEIENDLDRAFERENIFRGFLLVLIIVVTLIII